MPGLGRVVLTKEQYEWHETAPGGSPISVNLMIDSLPGGVYACRA
jgi:hypothetical protein